MGEKDEKELENKGAKEKQKPERLFYYARCQVMDNEYGYPYRYLLETVAEHEVVERPSDSGNRFVLLTNKSQAVQENKAIVLSHILMLMDTGISTGEEDIAKKRKQIEIWKKTREETIAQMRKLGLM
jgi:hypothetical protein